MFGSGAIAGGMEHMGSALAARLRSLGDDLAASSVSPWSPFGMWKARLPAPELLPLGAADAMRASGELRALVRWVDDGECYSRAAYGAAHLERLFGTPRTGVEQASHAAIAVVPTSMRRTGWTFHAATAFRSAEDGSIRVVDHLLGARHARASGTFTVDEWAGLVGARPSKVRIQHEVDNIPTGSGPITVPATARSLRGMGRRLVRSLERAG